jgi:uncharacterized membrane protein YhhN
MKKESWILLFILVLAGHVIGIQLHNRYNSVVYQGGHNYIIDFKKKTDPEQVRNDLRSVFEEDFPIVKITDDSTKLEITTTYMINNPGPLTDSIIFSKLMTGLKKHLPPGITYQQFDREYRWGSQKNLPALEDRRPKWIRNIVFPFLQYGCKALLLPLLIVFLFSSLSGVSTTLKKWIFAALFFSWAGDVLLMFQAKKEIFFLLGLASFLIAHIFYIVFFHYVRVRENVKSNPWLLVIVVVYYAALISWLSPFLGDMKLPVRIYGIIISIMLMLAMHMLSIRNKIAGKWMMWGALLFVISDSVLAINKFYEPFEAAGIVIMLTYGMAQLFIVKGAVGYINSSDKE